MPTSTDPRAREWLARLVKLKPASGHGDLRGKAPHKPLLLLCLLDMVENGELPSRVFTRTPGLVLRFRSYGTLVSERWPTRLDIRKPLYHLSTQRLWEPLTVERRRATSADTSATFQLDPDFFDLLSDPDFRLQARMILISKYFEPVERIALFETLGIQSGGAEGPNVTRVVKKAEEAAKRKGRSARFSVLICSQYHYTCALTGYRCVTSDGTAIVDAAHIEAWSSSQNDELGNGLALSKNAHWLFDEGLWAVDDDLRIVIQPQRFVEYGPEAMRLSSFAGCHLQFDPQSTLRPSASLLRAHRMRNGFRGM